MRIEILGTGCAKCKQLEQNTKVAVEALKLGAEIVHITDAIAIAQKGVMQTPALVIDGKLVSKGKVLSTAEIEQLLQK